MCSVHCCYTYTTDPRVIYIRLKYANDAAIEMCALATTLVWLSRAAVNQQPLHAEVNVVWSSQVAHWCQEMSQGLRHWEPSNVVYTMQMEESVQSFSRTSTWWRQLTPAHHQHWIQLLETSQLAAFDLDNMSSSCVEKYKYLFTYPWIIGTTSSCS